MKKKFKKSLQMDLIICFMALTILIIGSFVTVSILYTDSNLKKNAEKTNLQLIEQVGLNVENYIDNIDMLLDMEVKQQILHSYLETPDRYDFYQGTQMLLSSILNSRSDLYSAAILNEQGECIIAAPDTDINEYARLSGKRWFKKAQKSKQEIVISTHVQNMLEGKYQWVITVSKKLPDTYGQETDKMMIIDLNYEVIIDLCTSVNLGKKGYVYILDENGQIVYHPQQELILSGVKTELIQPVADAKEPIFHADEHGNEKLYTSYQSEKTGWTVVGVSYVSEILNDYKTNQRFFFTVANILLFTALITAIVLSLKITKPIKKLQEVMKKVQKDDFEPIYVPVEGQNEIADLCDSYNHMITCIDELLASNIQKAKEQRTSEMKALQAQINPHFLYNTLDSIVWTIETDDKEQAIRMTSALAKFFRKAIGNSKVFITIDEELEYTRQYLIIQRLRYKDKIDFDIQVNPDIKMYSIIKLVLQPLVENALYHGLKYKKGKGLIQITGYLMGDKIWLKVSDNGVGMERETLDNLFIAKEDTKSIGLANVQSRIQLYYGKEYGLQVESERGIGTTVTLVIPAKDK